MTSRRLGLGAQGWDSGVSELGTNNSKLIQGIKAKKQAAEKKVKAGRWLGLEERQALLPSPPQSLPLSYSCLAQLSLGIIRLPIVLLKVYHLTLLFILFVLCRA